MMKINPRFLHIVVFISIVTLSCEKKTEPVDQEVVSQSLSVTDTISAVTASDPLPSWNDSKRKATILDFVKAVTDSTGRNFVPPTDRIAVFDNDGTLWSEQPYFFELQFTFDRIIAMAPDHPRWKRDKLIQAVVEFDKKKILSFGGEGIFRLITLTHSEVTTDQFEQIVRRWVNTAKHPKTGKLYKEMVFQPMLELIQYLQTNDFKVYIVSGGWLDFIRPWSEEVYGIPREQVIGSRQKLAYKVVDGKPVLEMLPEVDFINNDEAKVFAIHQVIGKRPILAFGNSDGDIQMLEWTGGGRYTYLSGLIHHTDARREWAYDKESNFGRLDAGLGLAAKNKWLMVDMKKDWRVIYPFELTK